MKLGKVLLITGAIIMALGIVVLNIGLYQYNHWNLSHNYQTDNLYSYKDVLMNAGYGIIVLGIGLVIGGFIKITKVNVNKKQILKARIKYFETLMADNRSIREDIEKAYTSFIVNNGNYYDKKLKMNFTSAVWAALYWLPENSDVVSKIDPGNELFGSSTPSAVISGPAPPPG